MERTLPEEKVVAGGFLQKVLTNKDLAFVISFDVSVDLLQDLTGACILCVQDWTKRASTPTRRVWLPWGTRPCAHRRRQNKGTLLFDAVYLAADEILSRQVGRKTMIILPMATMWAASCG